MHIKIIISFIKNKKRKGSALNYSLILLLFSCTIFLFASRLVLNSKATSEIKQYEDDYVLVTKNDFDNINKVNTFVNESDKEKNNFVKLVNGNERDSIIIDDKVSIAYHEDNCIYLLERNEKSQRSFKINYEIIDSRIYIYKNGKINIS